MNNCYAYYGSNPRGKSILYIPDNLIGISNGNDYNFDYDPNTLKGVSLLFGKKLICLDDFIKKGWNIHKIEVLEHFIKGLQELCFRKESGKNIDLENIIQEKAREIADYVHDLFEFESDRSLIHSNDYLVCRKVNEDENTEEDIEFWGEFNDKELRDSWWKNGEQWDGRFD